MGVDPRAKSMSEANGRARVGSARAAFTEGGDVGPNELHAALRVIVEFIREEVDAKPDKERPKVSLAWLGDNSWVASVVSWGTRQQVAEFSATPGRAVYKLADRICQGGDVWRTMREKT